MWQTKYASAVPKNLGLGLNFRPAVKAISCLGVRSPWYNPDKIAAILSQHSNYLVGTYIFSFVIVHNRVKLSVLWSFPK